MKPGKLLRLSEHAGDETGQFSILLFCSDIQGAAILKQRAFLT